MTVRHVLGLDIGTNSVGSAWIDTQTGEITAGLSVFPAGVDETDDKRGDPKNAKRRMTRRTRVTLARRAARKRELRLQLIRSGLLPADPAVMKAMLETTDPWQLRRKGLDAALTPHEFGRVLMHLAQRRGALGLRPAKAQEEATAAESPKAGRKEPKADVGGDEVEEDGKLKAAIDAARSHMIERKARSYGEFIWMLRKERVTPVTTTDQRSPDQQQKGGPRMWCDPVRNKAGKYENAADRAMIREEFHKLWAKQASLSGPLAALLTDDLRRQLDDPDRTAWDKDPSKSAEDRLWYKHTFKEGGLLFGQRRQTWDMGTLGRCVLEPTERCAPKADMHASFFRVVETVNNLMVIEQGRTPRPLTKEQRDEVMKCLRGPLGVHTSGKFKGQPRRSVTVTDLRCLPAFGWGKASKHSKFRFNIESDPEREINTDWFHREIVIPAFGESAWDAMTQQQRESVNRAVLKFDPNEPQEAARLHAGAMAWWKLSPAQADALIAGWMTRRPLEERLSLSRKAIRNLLPIMKQMWSEPGGGHRWLTQIEARKLIAEDQDYRDVTTEKALDHWARRRYATGAKGLNAADRYYQKKHPLSLPPAPMLSNPVVRKAIHEVRRHIEAHIQRAGFIPDRIVVELAREARMGGKDADRILLRNRLRERIRKNIIATFELSPREPSQQRAAVDRVVLAVQQNGVCPLCLNKTVTTSITPRMAAAGQDCEVAHIIPRGIGGGNGLRNLVLAHTRCNREMGRQTPRQFWDNRFDEMMSIVERMYCDIERLRGKAVDKAAEDKLWAAYFDKADDEAKVNNFKKTKQDLEGHTERDLTDTRYATRQVLAYLADALYEGKGLPERGGDRKIFTTDGRWTGELRREWGLYHDVHAANSNGVEATEVEARREKNRGDHRHHALDAVAIALTDRAVQVKFENRVKEADKNDITVETYEAFCRENPIRPPDPFTDRDDLRARATAAIFGQRDALDHPVCHRQVKRKLIGALHEETLFGPVVGRPGLFCGTKSILALSPNHLRVPEGWDELSATYRRAKSAAERKEFGRRLAEIGRAHV